MSLDSSPDTKSRVKVTIDLNYNVYPISAGVSSDSSFNDM